MRIIAYDRFRPGVTLQTVTPYLPEEVAKVWRLWKAGVVRENYARADEPGVVIVFELASAAEAQRYVDDSPPSKAGLRGLVVHPADRPAAGGEPVRPGIDLGEPLDRTQARG